MVRNGKLNGLSIISFAHERPLRVCKSQESGNWGQWCGQAWETRESPDPARRDAGADLPHVCSPVTHARGSLLRSASVTFLLRSCYYRHPVNRNVRRLQGIVRDFLLNLNLAPPFPTSFWNNYKNMFLFIVTFTLCVCCQILKYNFLSTLSFSLYLTLGKQKWKISKLYRESVDDQTTI